MALMAQNPDDVYQMAVDPASQYAPVQMAAAPPTPVNPHDSLTAPIAAAPQPVTMAAGGAVPDKPAKMSALQPQEDRAQKQLMADYQKEDDPYGSPDNHPGFFGKLLHGLNVATGGTGRLHIDEQRQAAHLDDLAKQESEENLQGAQAGEAGARQAATEESTKEAPQKDADTHALVQPTIEHMGAETKALTSPADKDPYMATYRSLTNMGMSPSQALQEIEKDKAMALKPSGLVMAIVERILRSSVMPAFLRSPMNLL